MLHKYTRVGFESWFGALMDIYFGCISTYKENSRSGKWEIADAISTSVYPAIYENCCVSSCDLIGRSQLNGVDKKNLSRKRSSSFCFMSVFGFTV